MGKKPSQSLHELIASLSPAEKKQFRIWAQRQSRGEGNLYLQLFDFMTSHAVYDEVALRATLNRRLTPGHLSTARNYLYQALLQCLSRKPRSPEARLREALDHCEWLHARGQLAQARKTASAGYKLACQLHSLSHQAEFLRWQRRLLKTRGGGDLREALTRLGRTERETLQLLSLEAALRDLRGRVQALYLEQTDLPRARLHRELKTLLADEAMKRRPPEKAGFQALLAWHYAHAYAAMMQGAPIEARRHLQHILDTWDQHPAFRRRQPLEYYQALTLFVDNCIRLGELSGLKATLDRFDKPQGLSRAAQAGVIFSGHHLRLRYAIATGHTEAAMSLTAQVEAALQQWQRQVAPSVELTLRYNLGALHFFAGKNPAALRQFYLLRSLQSSHTRPDIIQASRLVELAIALDSGDPSRVEGLLRSFTRYKARRTREAALEEAMTHLASTFLKNGGTLKGKDLKQCLVQLKPLGEEGALTGLGELQVWLRSHLEGKEMKHLLMA